MTPAPPRQKAKFRPIAARQRKEIVIGSADPDPYVRWMRPRGGLDFGEDFVRPGAEDGVHLEVEPQLPRPVLTDRIAPENVRRLIRRIRFCSGR